MNTGTDNMNVIEMTGSGSYMITVIKQREELGADVMAFITKYDGAFYPPLSSRVSIDGYVDSLFAMDARLIVCRSDKQIIGLIAVCLNHPLWKYTYQYVLMEEAYRRHGIAGLLLEKAYSILKEQGAVRIVSRTWSTNTASIQHFKKYGFVHFDTVMNDRGEGIHSYYYTKVLQPLVFTNQVTLLGMIGGMGTFATGNFIRNLSCIPHEVAREQEMLSYVVINAADIPDRLAYINEGRTSELVQSMIKALDTINQERMSHLLVLCFTVHPFINELPLKPNVELINLVTVCDTLLRSGASERCLLVAAKGSYFMHLFDDSHILLPPEPQMNRIHEIIFEIKKGVDPAFYKDEIAGIVKHNDCDTVLLGCTDLHGMFGFNLQYDGIMIIDPLIELIFHIEHARRQIS